MKIAVTASGPNLESATDPRFGRAAYFIIVDTETGQFKAIQNPNVMATGGAGIQSAQLVVMEGVQAVVSGSFGPNAMRTLAASGVQMYEGISGTVQEAVERFKSNQLNPVAAAPAGAVPPMGAGYGGGAGFGPGMGGGFGRGMGGGRGRGGRGYGMGWTAGVPTGAPGFTQPAVPQVSPVSAPNELEILKEQAKQLAEQLRQINNRIKELEKD
ncbi:MAG: dinitrogenase iron-molybdenum cofactor biosynthesis protein [Calditrichaeota bacterium]|nr:dinitrogenase iron-molybdenum cofactor biosynthesis protein [Calditrichota bacterium]